MQLTSWFLSHPHSSEDVVADIGHFFPMPFKEFLDPLHFLVFQKSNFFIPY
ncbi:MAG: hypothetical protein VX943_09500 [SAR324 cluster bacterium]|nr:hypothetical protein [SAR324 cluster bacterium]